MDQLINSAKREGAVLNDKETIDGARMLALQFFTAYSRMLGFRETIGWKIIRK